MLVPIFSIETKLMKLLFRLGVVVRQFIPYNGIDVVILCVVLLHFIFFAFFWTGSFKTPSQQKQVLFA